MRIECMTRCVIVGLQPDSWLGALAGQLEQPHFAPRRVRRGRVIRSFRDPPTERLCSRQRVKSIDPRIERVALRKLVMLHAAELLDDLRLPPRNRLEAPRGDRGRTTQHLDQPAMADLLHLDRRRTHRRRDAVEACDHIVDYD